MDSNQENNNIPTPFPPKSEAGKEDPKTEPQADPVQPSGQAAPAAAPRQTAQAQTAGSQPSAQQKQQAGPQQQSAQKQEENAVKFTLTQARHYFESLGFVHDVAQYKAYVNRKTGYSNLDAVQPLYPGFYALGAISSLGKTTFVHQMADQIAASGEWVLYISLEQTKFELFSKSISRRFFLHNREEARQTNQPSTYPTPTAMELRREGYQAYPDQMLEQVNSYINAVDDRLIIMDGSFAVTVEDIVWLVSRLDAEEHIRPVIIVDYLQIIAPSEVNGRILDTKTSIDHIVHTLKALQSKYNLTIIAISSINRSNYLAPIDYESYKESGGIEYTADVVWGLQLSVLHDPDYEKEKRITKQREMIAEAKAASPRAVELVCLKNRYGRSSYTVYYDYYSANDTFIPRITP